MQGFVLDNIYLKILEYKVMTVPTLLYGRESWVLRRRNLCKIQAKEMCNEE
jgi:hypothetical protein